MDQQLKDNLGSGDSWKRGLFILLFAVCYAVAEVVVWGVVVLQFLFLIITGEDNTRLRALGASLALYIAELVRYLTMNQDDKPFPFRPWPGDEPLEGELEREPEPEVKREDRSDGAAYAAAGVAAGVAAATVAASADSDVVEGELMGDDGDMPEAEDVAVIDDDRPDAGETESGV